MSSQSKHMYLEGWPDGRMTGCALGCELGCRVGSIVGCAIIEIERGVRQW